MNTSNFVEPTGALLKTITMSLINKASDYVRGSYQELKKVVWPTRKEVIQHTALVIGISVGVAAFLGAVDFLLSTLLGLVI